MTQITTAEPETELEPWQEFDPGPEPGDRGVDQAGRVYVWHPGLDWQPEPEPEMEAEV